MNMKPEEKSEHIPTSGSNENDKSTHSFERTKVISAVCTVIMVWPVCVAEQLASPYSSQLVCVGCINHNLYS